MLCLEHPLRDETNSGHVTSLTVSPVQMLPEVSLTPGFLCSQRKEIGTFVIPFTWSVVITYVRMRLILPSAPSNTLSRFLLSVGGTYSNLNWCKYLYLFKQISFQLPRTKIKLFAELFPAGSHHLISLEHVETVTSLIQAYHFMRDQIKIF